jgi:arylsulfatase
MMEQKIYDSNLTRRDFLKVAGLTTGLSWFSTIKSDAISKSLSSAIKSGPSTPNIVLIIADALRSDHVSANGYNRSTTPNLDKWVASQGISFQNATTPTPWTYPANAAMMTGRSPFKLAATWDNTTLPTDVTTLAEYLHKAGYYTAGFVSAPFIEGSRGFSRGFDIYDDSVAAIPRSEPGMAGEINSRVFNWLENNWSSTEQPLFLFLYYFDPHTWFNPAPPYDTLYDTTYTGSLTAEAFADGQDVVSGLVVPTKRDIEHILALYDGEISYWDAQLGEMLTTLQNNQLLNNTLVIVTADHGEMFGTHDKWIHGNCLYDDVLRVPFFMRYSGVIPASQVESTPVQNMDLMPTILDWAGIPIPPELEAVSLRLLAEGQKATTRDIFCELEGVTDPDHWAYSIAPRTHLRSIQRGNWKYIHHLDNSEADELYQLNPNSPYETDNLISSEPALAEELRQALFDWFGIAPYQIYSPFFTK